MRSASSETSSSSSSSSPPPARRSRASTMSLSVSAVSTTRGTISRMSSSESSVGSESTPTPRHQRQKKRVIQLVFPYAPAVVSDPYKIASEAEPLKSMPLCLVPNDATRQLPPILHLGWPIDEDKLLEWCAIEGFQRSTTDINGHWVFDYTETVTGALLYFAQRSGAKTFKPYIQLTCHTREPVIIALTSNYTLDRELDGRRPEIFALGSLLRREGFLTKDSLVAKWYIDFKEWQWVATRPK